MPLWSLRTDRRSPHLREHARRAITSICAGIDGLSLTIIEDDLAHQTPDQGAFRDFIPLATIAHERQAVLEYILEEIITECGWIIDISRGEPR